MLRLLRLLRGLRLEKPPEVPLFCECNDVDCLFFLPIEEEVYLDTRARHPKAAMVLPGHEDEGDIVLEQHDTYKVVIAI